MNKFEISADSTCDLYASEYKELNVFVAPLEYTMAYGDDIVVERDDYSNQSQYIEFYGKLRKGFIAKTSILNVDSHIKLFTKMLESGIRNILHISQGYGLSPTVDNANKAIEEVKKSYPDANIIAIESDTTTVGEGMVVRSACKLRDEGESLEEAVKQIEGFKYHIQHFVLVNDLKFLARGGRISKASASIGSMLQVKPILEFGRDGKLKVCRKEIGLKKAMNSIVADYAKFTRNEKFPFIYIVHTDNLPLAQQLQDMFAEKYDIRPEIRIMGPIIGAHVGPGAVAYAFISNEDRPYD